MDPKTFDVLSFAQGRSYPEDDVTIYTDHAAAYKVKQLETAISNSASQSRVDALEAQREALVEKVKASALTFHLVGIPDSVIEDISAKADAKFGAETSSDEKNLYLNRSYLAAHISKVTNVAGEEDPRVWDADQIEALEHALPDESYARLFSQMTALTFKARYFQDFEVSPDFSQTP